MIVRINQFNAPHPEAEAGWPPDGRLGPLLAAWPAGTRGFEILILERDETSRPLSDAFRQQQFRQLIPQVVAALREPAEDIVVRLDGRFADRELFGAYAHLTDEQGLGHFAVSTAAKLNPAAGEPLASVRVQPTSPEALQRLCSDPAVGLERSVRLRVFSIPAGLVEPMLDTDSPDDERWPELLGKAGFVLGTVKGLLALHVLTTRFDAGMLKTRLMKRLASVSQQQQSSQPPASAGSSK
jgi:hypothetical protein